LLATAAAAQEPCLPGDAVRDGVLISLRHQHNNAILAAIGYNFSLLLRWLRLLLRMILAALHAALPAPAAA
jgi:hypothetical protein